MQELSQLQQETSHSTLRVVASTDSSRCELGVAGAARRSGAAGLDKHRGMARESFKFGGENVNILTHSTVEDWRLLKSCKVDVSLTARKGK